MSPILVWGTFAVITSIGFVVGSRLLDTRLRAPWIAREGEPNELPTLLERARIETRSRAIALFDLEGLCIATLGMHDTPRLGALIGVLAGALCDGRRFGLCDVQTSIALHGELEEKLHLRTLSHPGGVDLVLVTAGSRRPPGKLTRATRAALLETLGVPRA